MAKKKQISSIQKRLLEKLYFKGNETIRIPDAAIRLFMNKGVVKDDRLTSLYYTEKTSENLYRLRIRWRASSENKEINLDTRLRNYLEKFSETHNITGENEELPFTADHNDSRFTIRLSNLSEKQVELFREGLKENALEIRYLNIHTETFLEDSSISHILQRHSVLNFDKAKGLLNTKEEFELRKTQAKFIGNIFVHKAIASLIGKGAAIIEGAITQNPFIIIGQSLAASGVGLYLGSTLDEKAQTAHDISHAIYTDMHSYIKTENEEEKTSTKNLITKAISIRNFKRTQSPILQDILSICGSMGYISLGIKYAKESPAIATLMFTLAGNIIQNYGSRLTAHFGNSINVDFDSVAENVRNAANEKLNIKPVTEMLKNINKHSGFSNITHSTLLTIKALTKTNPIEAITTLTTAYGEAVKGKYLVSHDTHHTSQGIFALDIGNEILKSDTHLSTLITNYKEFSKDPKNVEPIIDEENLELMSQIATSYEGVLAYQDTSTKLSEYIRGKITEENLIHKTHSSCVCFEESLVDTEAHITASLVKADAVSYRQSQGKNVRQIIGSSKPRAKPSLTLTLEKSINSEQDIMLYFTKEINTETKQTLDEVALYLSLTELLHEHNIPTKSLERAFNVGRGKGKYSLNLVELANELNGLKPEYSSFGIDIIKTHLNGIISEEDMDKAFNKENVEKLVNGDSQRNVIKLKQRGQQDPVSYSMRLHPKTLKIVGYRTAKQEHELKPTQTLHQKFKINKPNIEQDISI